MRASVTEGGAKPARLWLVRHAQPLVAPGLCYGRLDVAADAAATAASAQALAAVLPSDVRLAHHSPLLRCEQLAQTLQALRPDLTLNADARLQELDFGAWEGHAWNAIGHVPVDAWTAAFATHRPGGGENLAAMLLRVAAALEAARRQALAAQEGSDILWITHAGVARCVQWLLQHGTGVLPRADQWPAAARGFGAWEVVSLV